MADKPILFSGPMVQALLAGTKTQTRRAIPAKALDAYYEYDDWCSNVSAGIPCTRKWEREFFLERLRIQPGDRLYVREHWRTVGSAGQFDSVPPRDMEPQAVWYVADGEAPANEFVGKHRQAMHMPRWASRLTLTVTDVRIERLQDISTADAMAEGIDHSGDGYAAPDMSWVGSPELAYRCLWERINGPGSWDANPWVAAYTFTVERGNIDQLARAA